MMRLNRTERTMALQRLEAASARIADLEAAIQRLKERGLPTVEAERILHLLRQSQAAMQRLPGPS
jgi:hypothetical protein